MKVSPRIPSKAQRDLRSYERRWLPPLSAGAMLGMFLFFLFIGSAIKSMFSPVGTMQDLYSPAALRAQEKAACALKGPPLPPPCPTSARNATIAASTPRKIIFMQPYGGLGSRLRGVASALTLGRAEGVQVVIVWQDAEHGFTGAWGELFEEPKLPLGCFPGAALRPETAACTVHTVNSRTEWLSVRNRRERMAVGGEVVDVLCMKSVMYLTAKQRELKWFYKMLKPAAGIYAQLSAFMGAQNWTDPGVTWVGVHARRTDLMLRCTSANCAEGISVEEALPLSKFTDAMKEVAALAPPGSRIRFYLATDDPAAEERMKTQLDAHALALSLRSARVNNNNSNTRLGTHLNNAIVAAQSSSQALPSAATLKSATVKSNSAVGTTSMEADVMRAALGRSDYGTISDDLPIVVSLPKATRDAAEGWLSMRSVVSGLEEAVADLYLLSRCHVLLGTVGSTFSQTARLMGDSYFITIGADLELKN